MHSSSITQFGRDAGLCACGVVIGGARSSCRLLGISNIGKKLHIVMPLYERGSLAQRIAEEGALPPNEVVEVAIQLLEGLRDLHHCNIVHRDIKPQNVLIDDRGTLLLADFGLATVAEGAMKVSVRRRRSWAARELSEWLAVQSASVSGHLVIGVHGEPWAVNPVVVPPQVSSRGTRVVDGMGTEHYMPPEQWDTELGPHTAASDAYALAATLCHVASGQPPHGIKNRNQILTDVIVRKRLPEVPESVPEPLRSAVQGALRFEAQDRTSAADMLRAARASRDTLSASR